MAKAGYDIYRMSDDGKLDQIDPNTRDDYPDKPVVNAVTEKIDGTEYIKCQDNNNKVNLYIHTHIFIYSVHLIIPYSQLICGQGIK